MRDRKPKNGERFGKQMQPPSSGSTIMRKAKEEKSEHGQTGPNQTVRIVQTSPLIEKQENVTIGGKQRKTDTYGWTVNASYRYTTIG